jgi:8-amino-7-oxononanoate synthase
VAGPHTGCSARIERELTSLAAESQLRRLELLDGVNLCSNDYLGLARDPRLRQAVIDALASGASAGSTGSRLLSGNSRAWEELESELATFAGTEAALYFSSGYGANIGLFSSIARPGDTVFSDAANHASIIDGIRLSGARKVIFPHLDLDYLERELRAHAADPADRFVVTESVFSMDGDRAALPELLSLARRYGAELIVDEAHATGVHGPRGRGLVAAAGVTENVLAIVHTCGKALASMGGFVCGSQRLKQYLVNRARTFIFSTALPPYMAAQVRVAVTIAANADRERSHLFDLTQRLRHGLRAAGFDTARSDSQIVPVILGRNDIALDLAAALQQEGFAVRAIRPPSVAHGSARLRLTLYAGLPTDTVDRFLETIARAASLCHAAK